MSNKMKVLAIAMLLSGGIFYSEPAQQADIPDSASAQREQDEALYFF